MKLLATDTYTKLYLKLPKDIRKKLVKQESLFKNNTFHPSLNTEKIEPKGKGIWTYRVDKKYRVAFRFEDPQTAVLLAVGPHDWIYRIKF